MKQLSKTDILAAVAPLIAVASGAVATWLLVHVHVLNVFVSGHNQLARLIASAVTFALTAGLVWLSTHEHILPISSMKEAQGADAPIPVPPIKQLMALLAPYISIAVGTLAAWLEIKLHFLATFHIDQTELTQVIGAAVVFIVTAVITWLAHHDIIKPELSR